MYASEPMRHYSINISYKVCKSLYFYKKYKNMFSDIIKLAVLTQNVQIKMADNNK